MSSILDPLLDVHKYMELTRQSKMSRHWQSVFPSMSGLWHPMGLFRTKTLPSTLSYLITVPSWLSAETMHLRLGLETPRPGLKCSQNPVFQLRSHTWFQDLMKLRFLMSHHRKNSMKDKVIGKKWIYLERNTLHRESVGHLRR